MGKRFYSKDQLQAFARHEIVLTVLCVGVGICLNWFKVEISGGILPAWLSRFLPVGHHGFVCPFCGGTRAFVYVLRAEFGMAARCSLLGTAVALWLLTTFPVRGWFLLKGDSPAAFRIFSRLKRFERAEHFLLFTAACFVLQLVLHFSGRLPWLPLAQMLGISL